MFATLCSIGVITLSWPPTGHFLDSGSSSFGWVVLSVWWPPWVWLWCTDITYIKFHGECIYRGCYSYKSLTSCNRNFNDFELLFSILELFCKDAIQSYILYRFYKSQSDILQEPTCYFVVFALCSLVAHSKLGTCFCTKLCGCGVGEQSCCKPKFESDPGDKVFKVIACFIGFISSGICLLLTIMSITDGFQAPGHIFTSVAECFHAAKTGSFLIKFTHWKLTLRLSCFDMFRFLETTVSDNLIAMIISVLIIRSSLVS